MLRELYLLGEQQFSGDAVNTLPDVGFAPILFP